MEHIAEFCKKYGLMMVMKYEPYLPHQITYAFVKDCFRREIVIPFGLTSIEIYDMFNKFFREEIVCAFHIDEGE